METLNRVDWAQITGGMRAHNNYCWRDAVVGLDKPQNYQGERISQRLVRPSYG